MIFTDAILKNSPCTAMSIGVLPKRSTESTGGSKHKNNSAISTSPRLQAQCNGVNPILSLMKRPSFPNLLN